MPVPKKSVNLLNEQRTMYVISILIDGKIFLMNEIKMKLLLKKNLAQNKEI